MTTLLVQAVSQIWKATPEMQDEVARLILDMVADGEPEALPPEHLAAVLEGEAQADRGEFASEAEVAAAFRRFRR